MENGEVFIPRPVLKCSVETGQISKALANAMGAMENPKRNKKVDFVNTKNQRVKYEYADLASIIDAIRKPLSSNGISWPAGAIWTGTSIVVEAALRHESGEWMSSELEIPCAPDVKSQGSAETYGRRYLLASLCGLAADDDDDGDAAMPTQTARQNGHADDRRTRQQPLSDVAGNGAKAESKEFANFLKPILMQTIQQHGPAWTNNEAMKEWIVKQSAVAKGANVKTWNDIMGWSDMVRLTALGEEIQAETKRREKAPQQELAGAV